jgi:hypothetical protein
MRVNLNALYLIEERLIHAFGRRAKRANLKRSDSRRRENVTRVTFGKVTLTIPRAIYGMPMVTAHELYGLGISPTARLV